MEGQTQTFRDVETMPKYRSQQQYYCYAFFLGVILYVFTKRLSLWSKRVSAEVGAEEWSQQPHESVTHSGGQTQNGVKQR